jgi:hypothetical protein
VKNQWIKTKLKLDLYLGMVKQCTKYQMNIWKHKWKKCGKQIIPDSFLRNLVKDQWIKTKLELDLYLGIAKQCTKCKMNIWKHEGKKCGKLRICGIFLSPLGHNFEKNQWIKTKPKLDLYLCMAKQCTKYKMNIWKHEGKKCGKLKIHNIFLSPRAITLWKINGSKPNSNLICILVWQSNVPNIKWISESTKEKSAENWKFVIFFKSKGHNFVKN